MWASRRVARQPAMQAGSQDWPSGQQINPLGTKPWEGKIQMDADWQGCVGPQRDHKFQDTTRAILQLLQCLCTPRVIRASPQPGAVASAMRLPCTSPASQVCRHEHHSGTRRGYATGSALLWPPKPQNARKARPGSWRTPRHDGFGLLTLARCALLWRECARARPHDLRERLLVNLLLVLHHFLSADRVRGRVGDREQDERKRQLE